MAEDIREAMLRKYPELAAVEQALAQWRNGEPITARCPKCQRVLEVTRVEVTKVLVVTCPERHTFFRAKLDGTPDAARDITGDLASGDPARIQHGLAWLGALEAGDQVAVPALETWLLQPFGASPPDQVVIDLAHVLARHRFVPPPSRAYVIRQLVELAVRYAVPQVLEEASREIRGQDDPAAATREAIDYLRARGLAMPRELAAAQRLLGLLLDAGPPVRRAVADALATWSPTDAKQAIVAAVLAKIDPDQRAQLGAPDPNRKTLPPMKFDDVAVNRQERYALGIERNSGKYYIAIPANNGIIDYDEYYEIDKDMFERYRADLDSALPFVIRCRDRLEDPRLLYQPSTRRGTAT